MKLLLTVALCFVSAGGLKLKPAEIIERFRPVLPGLFPKGLHKYGEAVNDVTEDIFHDVTGTYFNSEAELKQAQDLMKFMASMGAVQEKVDDYLVDPDDEQEMQKATDEELAKIDQQVEETTEQLKKAGIIKILPKKEGEEDEHPGMTDEEWEKARKEIEEMQRKTNPNAQDDDDDITKKEPVPAHILRQRQMKSQARRWRRTFKPQIKTSVMFNFGEEMVREIFSTYDKDRNGMINLKEFNALQRDTEGEAAVHTTEQFHQLIQEADPGRSTDVIRFKTFHDLYLEPAVSSKFETVLPADYQRLVDGGKLKGTAVPGLQNKDDVPEVAKIDA